MILGIAQVEKLDGFGRLDHIGFINKKKKLMIGFNSCPRREKCQ